MADVTMCGNGHDLVACYEHNETTRGEQIAALKELLATERMSADKTLEHNNRLINQVDTLQVELKEARTAAFKECEEIAREITRHHGECSIRNIGIDIADRIKEQG